MSLARPDFPLPETQWPPAAEFWRAAAERRLALPRCRGCGRLHWYPVGACRRCGASEARWEALSGRGSLVTWTVVRHAFLPAFRDWLPFVTGLVALEEDPGARLATRIVDCTPEELAADMPVEVVFRPLTFAGVEGEVLAPLFRPARGAQAGSTSSSGSPSATSAPSSATSRTTRARSGRPPLGS